MRSAVLLGSRDSPAFRSAIFPVRPEEVKVKPVPGWIRPVWPRWVAAMTWPWAVYVRRDVLDGNPDTLATLVCHELVHVRQWRAHGTVGFLWRYLADYIRGRMRRLGHPDAYRSISLEVEARHIADGA